MAGAAVCASLLGPANGGPLAGQQRRSLDSQTALALALVLEVQEQYYTAYCSHRDRTRQHLYSSDDLTLKC